MAKDEKINKEKERKKINKVGKLKRPFSLPHTMMGLCIGIRCKGSIFFLILQIVVCKMAYFFVFLLICMLKVIDFTHI